MVLVGMQLIYFSFLYDLQVQQKADIDVDDIIDRPVIDEIKLVMESLMKEMHKFELDDIGLVST